MIDHECTDMPVCPYCGHAMTCVADLIADRGGALERGDDDVYRECGECGRDYRVVLHVTHSYSTRKDDPAGRV